MLKQVPTVQTKCSTSNLISGFISGWIKGFNKLPKKESIGVLYSQNTLETGGTTRMYNWNFGNVKAVDDPIQIIEYCMLDNVWEMINGVKKIFQPPDSATFFRSFPTLTDGVAFQLDFLKNHRYATAWTAVEAGDPAGFAHLLKVAGYYTAPEADYVKDMTYFFNKFMTDPTFDNVVAALQPSLTIDPNTGVVTINGDVDLSPASSVLNTVINLFK